MSLFAKSGLSAVLGLVVGLCQPLSAEIFSARFDGPVEGPYSRDQAARFLTQASFGPTLEEIERLSTIGYNAWLTEQMAAPASLQLPFLDQLIQQAINAQQPINVWQDARQEIWFRNALTGSDQLRRK